MSKPHLVSYVSHSDVDLVLARLPTEPRARLREIHLDGDSRAMKYLGWVTRGRRDITLCARLPPRVSLRSYMYRELTAAELGAPDRGQWPPWAVRRMLLYDVLLHELGHMQRCGDRFAREPRAQEFANDWRGRLYAKPFDHPDPVHNAPTDDELATIPYWERQDKPMRMQLTRIVVGELSPDLRPLGDLPVEAARFLRRIMEARGSS